jgi:DNA-binding transcriptional MerR regulator
MHSGSAKLVAHALRRAAKDLGWLIAFDHAGHEQWRFDAPQDPGGRRPAAIVATSTPADAGNHRRRGRVKNSSRMGCATCNVAKRAGVSVDTVRFYERRGVLPPPVRRASGYREYSEATIERIRFAKALSALSFTLDGVADVLRAVDAGIATCERERPRFEAVLARIDEKIGRLSAIRRDLVTTLKRCREGSCTFLESPPPATNPSARRRGRQSVRGPRR